MNKSLEKKIFLRIFVNELYNNKGMECIELVKEKEGALFIGGCKLGDKPFLFYDNMRNYSVSRYDDKKGHIGCTIDVDTMQISNPLRNADISDVYISCDYYNGLGIRELYVCMSDYMEYPYSTQAEFYELSKKIADSGKFKVVMPELHHIWNFEMICMENKKCEVEFVWSKEDHNSNRYFIKVNVTPPIWTEENIFDTEAAINKSEYRLALKLGKRVNELSESEKKQAWIDVANLTLRFYDEVWGEKIDRSLLEYRSENLIGPGQLRSGDWYQIYKNAGMNDKEIKQLRKAHEPFAAALDDHSDMYRD